MTLESSQSKGKLTAGNRTLFHMCPDACMDVVGFERKDVKRCHTGSAKTTLGLALVAHGSSHTNVKPVGDFAGHSACGHCTIGSVLTRGPDTCPRST